MKIVKFKDGTFAVRRFCWFMLSYANAVGGQCWWPLRKVDYAKFKTLEEAKSKLELLTDKGVPIEEKK